VPEFRQEVADSHNNLGILLQELGKREEPNVNTAQR
jgi:hypothetical protein